MHVSDDQFAVQTYHTNISISKFIFHANFFVNRDGLEVAVAYFRAGFAPKHFPTEKVGQMSMTRNDSLFAINTFFFLCAVFSGGSSNCHYIIS